MPPAARQPNWGLIPPPLLTLPPAAPPPAVPTPSSLDVSTNHHKPKSLPQISSAHSKSRPLILPPNVDPNKESYIEPPTPSSQAPQNVTSLLTDVFSIMNGIMSQQALVASENELLEELTELVVILQEEVEELLMVADLVDEFVDEIDGQVEVKVEDLEAWVEDLGLGLGFDGLGGMESFKGAGGGGEWENDYGEGDERGRERNMDMEGIGYVREREDYFDSSVRMDISGKGRDRAAHVGELRLFLYAPNDVERNFKKERVWLRKVEVNPNIARRRQGRRYGELRKT